MSPYAISFLFRPKNRPDVRTPYRREDEEPLHFVVSNFTYRMVVAGDALREKVEEMWKRRR